MDIFDITIIGGGPVGLFASFYAGLRHMKTKIIDALPELGGQLTALYPEKYIYDVAGFPKVVAKELAKNLIEQGLHHNPTVCLNQKVESLHPDEIDGQRILKLSTHNGRPSTKGVTPYRRHRRVRSTPARLSGIRKIREQMCPLLREGQIHF